MAAAEVGLVLVLFFAAPRLWRASGFSDWQRATFGASLLSSCLLFFVVPLAFTLLGGRTPASCGLTTVDLRYHARVAWKAFLVLVPVTALFGLFGALDISPMEWLGATSLTIGFLLAGSVFAARSRTLASGSAAQLSWGGLATYVGLLAAGLGVSFLVLPLSSVAASIVRVLIFVGFLEELFFRGFMQERLNVCFGKPFRVWDVDFGLGMVLAAVAFGLVHPLSAADGAPWPWALWTGAFGLTLGFVREKTGAVVSPAMLHGMLLLPNVFFGSG